MTTIVFEPLFDGVVPPVASTEWSAGLDARAHLLNRWVMQHHADGRVTESDQYSDTLWLSPGGRALIPLGFKAALPEGWECQVRPRSGLALKYGISVINTPGTIDADYIGEWGVLLINHGSDTVCIVHGERIAQLVLAPVYRANWTEGEVRQRTSRTGGLGSTGNG